MRPCVSVSGYALHAMPAAFVLQVAVDVFAFEGQRDLFETAHFRDAVVHDFGSPSP